MEGSAHLLQLIRKMRSRINKLERENRALRGELQLCGQRTVPPESQAVRGCGDSDVGSLDDDDKTSAGSPGDLHGSIVTSSALAPKEQTASAMTVRRYPTTASPPAPFSMRFHWASKRPPSKGLLDMPGSVLLPAPPAAAQLTHGEEKGLEKSPASCLSSSHSSKMKLFRDHVYKCRGKVKAVSFLLPVDMSSHAEKQGCLQSLPNQNTNQLTTIAEKDM